MQIDQELLKKKKKSVWIYFSFLGQTCKYKARMAQENLYWEHCSKQCMIVMVSLVIRIGRKGSSICPVEPFQGMSHNLLRSDANTRNKVLPCNDLKAEQQLYSHARYHFLNAGTVPLSSWLVIFLWFRQTLGSFLPR